MNDVWRSDFLQSSPLFQPLASIYPKSWEGLSGWPSLATLNCIYPKVRSPKGRRLKFVPQQINNKTFEQQYEARIYLQGEVQTREHNWHDFFNYLVWRRFANIKSQMNAMHFKKQQQRWQRTKQRTTLENFLTLFDENGVVVLCDDKCLIEQLKSKSWHELFWKNRKALLQHMHFYVVGHALYEKLLNPYIGLTAKAIVLYKPQLEEPVNELAYIDNEIAQFIFENQLTLTPKELYPLPVLGIPGCYQYNEQESFYNNTDYFRS